jgi:hypothetical protein
MGDTAIEEERSPLRKQKIILKVKTGTNIPNLSRIDVS